MFSNLKEEGPSFGLSVSSRSKQCSEIDLGSPVRDVPQNLSNHGWEINSQSSLLQAVFGLKLDHVY